MRWDFASCDDALNAQQSHVKRVSQAEIFDIALGSIPGKPRESA